MKITAAALAVLLCTAIGYMKAEHIEDRLKMVNSFLNDIRHISMQIEFTSDPICIILDKICVNSELSGVWKELLRHINEGMSCCEAWKSVSQGEESLLSVLEAEEKAGLDNFFLTLGRSDKLTEKKNAEYTYTLLEDISARLKKNALSNKKVYKSVGVLIGIAIAILII